MEYKKLYKKLTLKTFFILVCIIILILIINKQKLKYINYINVAYALDKKYYYIAHCSMKSIMISQNSNTFINFYILVPENISEDHKAIINKISQQHHNCRINFLYINNKFNNLNPKFWSTAIFYRLIIQDLLEKESKILYLDCDTLIYKDLSQLYNYEITNKYYIGMLEPKDPFLKINVSNFINTGVLLINMEELRKNNISQKIIEFLIKNNNTIIFPINDSLNVICHKKNGYFSPKYVQWGFCYESYIDIYINNLSIKLNKTEVINAYKDPYIYHLIGNWAKPWYGISYFNKIACIDPFTRFYEIARKTEYYYEILNEFKIYKNY